MLKKKTGIIVTAGILCLLVIWKINDQSQPKNNEIFLSHFAGRWETEDQQMRLTFQEKAGEIELTSQNVGEQEKAMPQIMTVEDYDADYNRWILHLKEDQTFCYSIMQTGDKEITAQSLINKPGVAGTAKPFNYRWISAE